MARSTARKRALNTLYEADEKGQDFLSLLAERIEEPGAQTPLPDYAIEIVRGVADHRREIDYMLNEHSTGWKVRRMAVVDRNILRIAAWEIIFNGDVPDRVAIDEALGLAKTLSDGDSPAFIHGLLSAICDDTEGREAILHPENDEPDAQPSDDGHEPGEPAGEASHAEAETGDSEASEDDDIADGVDFDDMTFDDVSDDVAEAASEQTADPQAGQQDGESTSK